MTVPAAMRTRLAGGAFATLASLGACANAGAAGPIEGLAPAHAEPRIAQGVSAVPQIAALAEDTPQIAMFLDVCGAALVSPRLAADKLLDHGWDATIRGGGDGALVLSGREADQGMLIVGHDRYLHSERMRCWPTLTAPDFDESDLTAAAERLGFRQDRTGVAPGKPLESWSRPLDDGGVVTLSTRALADRRTLTLTYQRWREPDDGSALISLPLVLSGSVDSSVEEFLGSCANELTNENFSPRTAGRRAIGQKLFGGVLQRSCGGPISAADPANFDLSALNTVPGLEFTNASPGDAGAGAALQVGRWRGVTDDGRHIEIDVTPLSADNTNLMTLMTLTRQAPAADDEERS